MFRKRIGVHRDSIKLHECFTFPRVHVCAYCRSSRYIELYSAFSCKVSKTVFKTTEKIQPRDYNTTVKFNNIENGTWMDKRDED